MTRYFAQALIATGLSFAPLAVADANAAQIFRQYTATGSNFVLAGGSGSQAPIDPLTFVFTAKYDSTANFSSAFAGLSVQSDPLNMARRTFSHVVGPDALIFAPFTNGVGCRVPLGSACLIILGASSASPRLIAMAQLVGSPADPSAYTARTFALTFSDIAASVPEPATWAMMMLGFGAAGGMMRYRRRRTAVAYAR